MNLNDKPESSDRRDRRLPRKVIRRKTDLTRLARACEKLDPKEEQRLADEGLEADLKDWPEY